MKKVISSLFIGALVAVVPARGALISQSSCHFLRERPEPVIETVEVNFDEIRGAEPEPAQMQTVQKAAVHYLTNLTLESSHMLMIQISRTRSRRSQSNTAQSLIFARSFWRRLHSRNPVI